MTSYSGPKAEYYVAIVLVGNTNYFMKTSS